MRNRGFTLLEVVLAIGLSGAVIGLLAMAINLFLVRVDASRTQVETAQLARTLLNRIASDLHAVRYFPPASSQTSSQSFSGGSDETGATSSMQGIIGTETELRIDRSAVWSWEHLARQADDRNVLVQEDATPDPRAMPQTVRYLLGTGKELLAAKLAATGVSEQQSAPSYAGLYREQISSAAWLEQNSAAAIPLDSDDTGDAELFAPEVVDIAFAYFDGEELLTEWDTSAEESLPKAVEIRLTLLEEPFEQATSRTPNDRDELRREKENLVEYRRFVKLSEVLAPHEAEFPTTSTPGF